MKYKIIGAYFFATLAIIFGNLFWILFANDLKAEHLLTNSAIHVALSFIYPIICFAFYLVAILYVSIFTRKIWVWICISILSFVSYIYVLNHTWLAIAGEVVISGAICWYLFNFKRTRIIINNNPTFLGQFATAITGTTVIISLVVAFNFYNFYQSVLSDTHVVITDKILINSLRPVMRLYYDDLRIKDPNELFGAYTIRYAKQHRVSTDSARLKTLYVLGLPSADNQQAMSLLIRHSLDQSIIKIFGEYKREIPLLISFGLGIITQTLLAVSVYVSSVLAIAVYYLLSFYHIVKKEQTSVTIDTIIPEHRV